MAKTSNLGDPYTRRLTLRLSDAHMEFLAKMSDILGVSPSEYIRMNIQMQMVSMSKSVDKMANGEMLEVERHENVKTDKHDII